MCLFSEKGVRLATDMPCQISYLRTLYFHKQGFVATINLDDFQKFFEKQRSAGSKGAGFLLAIARIHRVNPHFAACSLPLSTLRYD
jgi:hypothetical protein